MPAVGVGLCNQLACVWLWSHSGYKETSLGRKLRDQPPLAVSLAVNKTEILSESFRHLSEGTWDFSS